MADNKKSIVLYTDLIHTFEELSDQEAGVLIKHLFRYVNDLNPEVPDRLTKIVFEPIKLQLKRDLLKWEKRAERSRENGRSGGRPATSSIQNKPRETQQVFQEPKEPVNDTVTVNVNDTVNVTDTVNTDKGDNEKSASKKPTPLNRKVVAAKSFENTECPFGNAFKKKWLALLESKKWVKKEQSAIDMSLTQLMKFDEDFAGALVENAIAGSYQGVVFSDTEANYEKYLKSKNGHASSRDSAAESRRKMANLATAILTGHQA